MEVPIKILTPLMATVVSGGLRSESYEDCLEECPRDYADEELSCWSD